MQDENNGDAVDLKVPIGERISRYFKDLFSNDDLRDSKE